YRPWYVLARSEGRVSFRVTGHYYGPARRRRVGKRLAAPYFTSNASRSGAELLKGSSTLMPASNSRRDSTHRFAPPGSISGTTSK
ncbi:MAG: hypothetical protein ABIR80_20585, partial [Opitutaceae bacterium]